MDKINYNEQDQYTLRDRSRVLAPSDMQIGGNHYKDFAVQPSEFIYKNKLGWHEGNAVKYICRHKAKGGKTDLEKAIHYLKLLIQLEYKDEATVGG